MQLSVYQRVKLMEVTRGIDRGSRIIFRQVEEFLREISFSGEEIKSYMVKIEPEGKLAFPPECLQVTKEVAITLAMRSVLLGILMGLEKKEELPRALAPVLDALEAKDSEKTGRAGAPAGDQATA